MIFFDANLRKTRWDTSTNVTSENFTVGSGSQRLLIVAIATQDDGGMTSVTYGGTPLTQLNTAVQNSRRQYLYYLKNPASGTNAIVVTTVNNCHTSFEATSFRNVDQDTTFEGTNQGNAVVSSSSLTVQLITAIDDVWLVAGGTITSDTTNINSNVTARGAVQSNQVVGADSNGEKAANTYNIAITGTGWAALCVTALIPSELFLEESVPIVESVANKISLKISDSMSIAESSAAFRGLPKTLSDSMAIGSPSIVKDTGLFFDDNAYDDGFETGTKDSPITSSGFLPGQSYWRMVRVATAVSAELDTAVKRSGAASLKLSATDATGRLYVGNENAPSLVAVRPSTEYTFNVYCKTNNVANDSVFCHIIEFTSALGTVTHQYTSKLSGTNDWTLLTVTFTTDPTTTFLGIYLQLNTAGNVSDAWFDDLRVFSTESSLSIADEAETEPIYLPLGDSISMVDETPSMIVAEQYPGGAKSEWRFKIKNASGNFIASLENARGRWFTQRMNDQSEAGFILDVDDDKCTSTILNLGVNELYIYYQGTLKWSGQLVSARKIASGDDIYWDVRAKDWVALLSKRFIGVESLREFTTTDAGQIAKTLIQETQALTNGDFGITYGTIDVSQTRSPTYDKKNILEAIRELSNQGDEGTADTYGFDFEITPAKVFNVHYPYMGTIRNEIVFRYPGNCENFEAFVNSWGIVNQEWGLGQHWTGNTAIVSRSDATSQATYKRREAIKNYKDVSVLNFLQDMVWQDIQWLKNLSTVIKFEARKDRKTRINDYNVGDGVSVVCDKFSIDEWLWVYERKIEIDDSDELKITLTVGN